MRPYRDYTGLERTPSSLAWLIRERAYVRGMLDRRLQKVEELPAEICELMDRLASIDMVIPMHEVPVEPMAIEGVRPARDCLFPPGEFQRRVINYLKAANGEPRYTSEIVMGICREAGIVILAHGRTKLKHRFTVVLGRLSRNGIVRKHHRTKPGLREEGLWSLITDANRDDAQAVPDGVASS